MPRRGGPSTPEGRARVSQNAIRHAILSNKPVIAGMETAEECDEFERGIIESWAPVGLYELELARSIAYDLRRLRRCRIYESGTVSRQVEEAEAELRQPDDDFDEDEDAEDGPDDEGRPVGDEPQAEVEIDPVRLHARQQLSIIPDAWSLERILRYETHLKRSLNQAAHELEAAQARRQGQQPALARVDFTASPSLKRPANDEAAFLRRVGRDMTYAELGLAAGKRQRKAKKR